MKRRQRVRLELRSQAAGDATLLRCSSPVGTMDLGDDTVVDELYDLQVEIGAVRICSRPDANLYLDRVSVENELLYRPERTAVGDLVALVRATASAADRIEATLLGVDGTEETGADA